ncbi:MAG: UbiA family prenyltransferase, partial [Actinomycetota bacterium]|nr:UbiA family prenyltransferase [Actinomycetota bacterium]
MPRATAAPQASSASAVPSARTAPSDAAQARPGAVRVMRPAAHGPLTWVRAIRVRQWPKNLLLFGAPAAAGALGQSGVLARVALAAVAFCLLSSGAYLLNDLRDAPEDRRHPVKRHRPIASRAITPGPALGVAVALLAAGLALAATLG